VAPSPSQASSLAPAGIGLALFVAAAQIRMDDPWADGVLLLVAAVPAVVLLLLGLAAAEGSQAERVSAEILLVAGLVLAAVAIARLGQVLGGEDATSGGGTLTWMLALFLAIAGYCARRARSVACLLIAALAAVALLLEGVNWIFDTDDVDVFRILLALAFAVLFLAGLGASGRAGTVLVAAAGVTVIVAYYAMGFFFAFVPGGDGLGWGWELIALIEACALLAYAVQRLEPGPGYLAFFVFVLFVMTAAADAASIIGVEGSDDRPSHSLVGWPLALAIGTAAVAALGLRQPPRT
jgi:hypothetical protein